MTFPPRVLVAPALAASALLALGACGASSPTASGGATSASATMPSSPSPAGTPAPGEHNGADIAFASQMIPHHRQAVEMADLAATRAASPKVRELALQIRDAQQPEITQMSGWLAGWGAPVPTGNSMGSMNHSDGATMGEASGTMSEQDMKSLSDASGTAFDVAFLNGMLAHHKGAVEMAQTELRDGRNPAAKALAQSISTSQTREITQMTTLLAQLKG